MGQMHRLFVVLASGLLIVACGSSDEDSGHGNNPNSEPMTGRLAAFQTELKELEDLIVGHEATVKGAADLAAVTTEETKYMADASGHQTEMGHKAEEMMPCTHEGHGPHMDALMTAMGKLKTELDAHSTNMKNAADLAATQTEETSHNTAMKKVLGEIRTEHDEMAVDAAQFSCPMEAAH